MRAVVDTGSGYTLIKEAAVTKLGGEINRRRNIPHLQGVTGSPLRVLGMVWLEIGVGDDEVHKQWFPVVPNGYLDADLLLGADVLARAPFHWNGKTNIIVWGNTPYVISHIKRQKGKVERIRVIPPNLTPEDHSKRINLVKPVRLEPYQSQFIPIVVKEKPGETLLVHPQPQISSNIFPLLTKVNENNTIYLPFLTTPKVSKILNQEPC